MKIQLSAVVIALSCCLASEVVSADPKSELREDQADFVHGAPESESDSWLLAAGGRIYDNWWHALDREKPTSMHPAYPATGKQSGANTWRCKECHGWDYRGRDGKYASGSHFTGIKGIEAAKGDDPAAIAKMLRGAPHGYPATMITDKELARVAAFVSRGQDETAKFVDVKTGNVKGDVKHGEAIFQTTCAACHGFDGRLLNRGDKDAPAYVGTDANAAPDEVLHKIRNSHPGAAMISLRAFPIEDAADVLAYAKTLPQK
ncbi:MAG: c-type cytochrome [Alphaproteobacteria bacterium]|nr:c-type cytochrome [Alphaproteobacteria bacterium]